MKNILFCFFLFGSIWGQGISSKQNNFKINYQWKIHINNNVESELDMIKNMFQKRGVKELSLIQLSNDTNHFLTKNTNLISKSQSSSWENMTGPFGGSVRQFYEYDNRLYARTDREVFLYEGNAWRSLNVGNFSSLIHFLYKTKDYLIINDYSGLHFSANGGETWESVRINGWIDIIDLYETQNGGFLLSTSDGIYISNDDKTEYSVLTLKDTNVYSVSIDEIGNIWACTQFGILKAKLNDFIWANVGLEGPNYPKIIFDSNNIVYTFANDRVLMSTDYGKTWKEMTGFWVTDIDLDDEDNLIVTTPSKIIILNPDGLVWESPVFEDFLLTTLFKENEILLGTLGSGAKIYNLKSEIYSNFSEGMNASTIRGILSMANGNILAYTDADTFYISSDNGLTWESTFKYWARCFESGNDGSVYAGAYGGIIKSENFGKTWEKLSIDVSPYYINAIDVSEDNNTICAGSSHGEIYVSNTAGKSFYKIKDADYIFVDAIEVIDNETYLIENGPLYYTNNAGKTLITIQDSLIGNTTVTDFVKDKMGYIYLSSYKGIFKSLDGINWLHLSGDISGISFLEIDQFDNLFAASGGTVYFSNNYGEDWEIITESFANTSFLSFAITADGYIFNGSQDRGLFRSKLDIKNVKIQSMYLSNNFPNPFNASTRIEYILPKDSFVELEVYDLLGRKIEVLVSEYKTEGQHFSNWQPINQSSGVYFYRLKIDTEYQVNKMIYLK